AEVLEALGLALRGARETVARQVDEADAPVQQEEVHLAGAPRFGRRARQPRAADQRIDQAGLADVGAAGEGDLRQVGRRQLLDLRAAHQELGGAREGDPRCFDLSVREVLAHSAALASLAVVRPASSFPTKASSGFSTLKRRISTYCCAIVKIDENDQ